jgi:hypothetical protein
MVKDAKHQDEGLLGNMNDLIDGMVMNHGIGPS